MRRALCVVLLLELFALCGFASRAAAAAKSTRQGETNWQRRDTAVYVVSTVNLLRTSDGRPAARVLMRQMGIARFDVYQDLVNQDLYYIQLKHSDGTAVGALAYVLGWQMPRSITLLTDRLGIKKASDIVTQAYRADPKQFMASFRSTMPS